MKVYLIPVITADYDTRACIVLIVLQDDLRRWNKLRRVQEIKTLNWSDGRGHDIG